jgi:hypothetical protein
MNILKKILIIFFLLFYFTNSFAAMVTYVHQAFVTEDAGNPRGHIQGIEFNVDGTKMFTIYRDSESDAAKTHINEYNLSRPFDVSSKIYAGDDERCIITKVGDDGPEAGQGQYDLEFSSDGKKFFFVSSANGTNANGIFKYNLTSPYDVSTCEFGEQNKNLGSTADPNLQNGSNAGVMVGAIQKNRPQGLEINDDGTKIFVIYHGHGSFGDTIINTRLLEYDLSTPYSLSTMSLVTDAGIELEDECANPMGIRFSNDGKRLWCVEHMNAASDVVQISLDVAYSTSSFTIDGEVRIVNLGGNANLSQPRGIAFSQNGLKMYVGSDRTVNGGDEVVELDLVCPFNIIGGKCPPITENKDRTGMALAQIELAKRTINFSTNSALNRLKWIRRNKDKQNLSNQNIKLNFSNSLLSSLKAVPISSFKKISNTKNKKDSNKKYFYWSEGSINLGRVGDTNISSTKKVNTNALTFGLDRFTDDYSLEGFAFRFGSDDVDIGSDGSNLDSNTYNITYYSTSPIKDDTKYLDKIFGIGKIRSDILYAADGKNLTADRTGNQIYGTFKIKDEHKRNKLTLIPSLQFDFGHTILNGYTETGTGAIEVEDQHVRTKNLRATMAVVEDLSTDKYTLKRHGKLEYLAELDRSSNFKYTYVGDGSVKFNETLHTGALHNLNGEIGIDIIFPEHYSVFIIYERNHAFSTGYTDNLYIALGYLPHEDTEYAFSLNGSDNLMSKFEIKKNINGYELTFNLNDDLTNLGDSKEASINLNKVF